MVMYTCCEYFWTFLHTRMVSFSRGNHLFFFFFQIKFYPADVTRNEHLIDHTLPLLHETNNQKEISRRPLALGI